MCQFALGAGGGGVVAGAGAGPGSTGSVIGGKRPPGPSGSITVVVGCSSGVGPLLDVAGSSGPGVPDVVVGDVVVVVGSGGSVVVGVVVVG